MALFPRRLVQATLDRLRPAILSHEGINKLLGHLNSRSSQALEAEWELFAVDAVARTGVVQHEPEIGTKRPDIRFRGSDGMTDLIADVTTVSDRKRHEENAVADVFAFVRKEARRRGTRGGIDVQVGSEMEGASPDQRMRLRLPERGKLHAFLKRHFIEFFRRIAARPDAATAEEVEDEAGAIRMAYNPSGRGWTSGSYGGYDVPYSLDRNPLRAALDRKRDGFAKIAFDGPKLILVFDGGCASLKARNDVSGAWGCDAIVGEFLRKTPAVTAVVTTSATTRTHPFAPSRQELLHRLHLKPGLDPALADSLRRLVHDAYQHLPPIVRSPQNALHDALLPPSLEHGSNLGAYKMVGREEFVMSTRSLLIALSGPANERQRDGLFGNGRLGESSHAVDFFMSVLLNGLAAEEVKIVAKPLEDDDEIVFRFAPRGNDGAAPASRLSREPDQGEKACAFPLSYVATVLAGIDPAHTPHLGDGSRWQQITQASRAMMNTFTGQGRLPVEASLIEIAGDGQFLSLRFGGTDAAISPFW